MPTYEYECTCCSSRFELKQSFDADALASCPQCGGSALRVFSPVPIIFKGSGVYVTDSGGNHSHSAPTDGDDETKSGNTKDGADEDKAGSTEEGG